MIDLLSRNVVPLAVSTGLYVVGIVLGGALGTSMRRAPSSRDVPAGVQFGLSEATTPTVVDLAVHNASVVALILAGTLVFGLTSIFLVFFNGITFGALASGAVANAPLPLLLAALVPHGVVELPAFWIAGAVGLTPAYQLSRYLLGKQEEILPHQSRSDMLQLSILVFVLVIVAAWIEAVVTPGLVGLLR